VCRRAEKSVYHFEVLTNTWDCVEAKGWEEERVEDIKSLIASVEGDASEHLPLPKELDRARKRAKDACDLEREFAWFLPQLRENKHDAKECSRDKRLGKIIRCIDPEIAQKQHEVVGTEFFAGTQRFDWRNELDVYAAFRNREKDLLGVLRGS
jgi:hypothetical protein